MDIRRFPAWGLALVAAVPLALVLASARRTDTAIFWALCIPAFAWFAFFILLGWKRTDEASREAHKFAWFWGAGAALVGALLFSAAVLLSPFGGELIDGLTRLRTKPRPQLQLTFVYGVLFAAIIQVLGYFAVWTGWWMSKRATKR